MEKNVGLKNILKILLILMLFIILISLVGYGYAKYLTSKSDTAQAEVASFRFELKNINGDSTATSQSETIDFPITRTDDNKNVEQGKLAPETYGRFDMIIDAIGTEVAYKYDLKVTVNDCPYNLKFYTNKEHTQEIPTIRTPINAQPEDNKTATFTITKYVPVEKANQEHKEIVYWNWQFETGTGNSEIIANDVYDTADMNNIVTMSIEAVGTQVVGIPAGIPEVEENKQTIEIVKLGPSQQDNMSIKIDSGSQEEINVNYTQEATNLENIIISSSDTSVATASIDLTNNKIIIDGLKSGSATISIRGEISWNIIKTIEVTVEDPMPELGEYVDLNTNYITQTTYDDSTTIEEDWRVFYVEPDTRYVWLIMSDYLPNSTNKASAAGLTQSGTYGIKSSSKRDDLLNGLDYLATSNSYKTVSSNTGRWKTALFSGNDKLSSSQVTVAGAVDLETWIASWNTQASTSETMKFMYYASSSSSSKAKGYKIKQGEGLNSEYNYNIYNITRTNTLYFPRNDYKNNCCGYWLASPSAFATDAIFQVRYNGYLGYNYYDSGAIPGIRPAVRLPANMLKKQETMWVLK